MTLTKAAPTDWAKWFAAVTGQPVEKVREKLEMGAESGKMQGTGNTTVPPESLSRRLERDLTPARRG